MLQVTWSRSKHRFFFFFATNSWLFPSFPAHLTGRENCALCVYHHVAKSRGRGVMETLSLALKASLSQLVRRVMDMNNTV